MTPAPSAISSVEPARTRRFIAKRDMILDAASVLINEKGVRGLSLAEVGSSLALSSTSITYYFRRLDDLTAACFARALDRLAAQVEAAGREPDLASRAALLVALNFADLDGKPGDSRAIVRLADLRATEDPVRAVLIERFVETFRRARSFFGEGGDAEARLTRTVRTHVLLDTLFTLPQWLPRYEDGEYPRVQARLLDLLAHGIAPKAVWDPAPLSLAAEVRGSGQERFLDVATRLINERGYRGTSVDRISAELNVTKGSFYHHLDAKDNLVLECFRRSFATLSHAQDAASSIAGDQLRRLTSTLAALLEVQFSDRMPLLRITALLALPAELRVEVTDRADRIALRFAGMVIDGVTEGSLMPVDPVIAGQVLLSSINAAYDLREHCARMPLDRVVSVYGSTLLHGLLGAS